MAKSRKALQELRDELKRAIELTESAEENCSVPMFRDLHRQAISQYRERLTRVEKQLERFRKAL